MDIKKFWANKNVIITGHTGFKGSWLTLLLTHLGANVIGISREKYDGIYKLSSVDKVLEKEYFIDISNNIKLPKKEIDKFNPDIIFHLAGQSLVSVGYKDPLDTINTNILGTYNVLDYFNKIDSVRSAVVSTTDKVYLNPAETNNELSEIGGTDYYSATKASSEFIIKSFLNNEPNINVSVVRSGNVLGGGDRALNRLIPDLIESITLNKEFILRQPKSTRPWQYVLDSLTGYMLAAQENFQNSKSEVYNLNSSSNNLFTAQDIVEKFKKEWGSDLVINIPKNNKFKEVKILNLDSSKANENLGWSPKFDLDELIKTIVKWEKIHLSQQSFTHSINEIKNYLDL